MRAPCAARSGWASTSPSDQRWAAPPDGSAARSGWSIAPTFLDELQDPDQLGADLEALARLEIPVRLTQGSASPPVFPRVIDRLIEVMPNAERETIEGAAHAPQLTVPECYVETIAAFATGCESLAVPLPPSSTAD